jgi:competence protein ComEC
LNDNERSMALMCEIFGWRVLLTGDVEDRALRHLTDTRGARGALMADVIVLPHHGAWREALPAFIESVQPAFRNCELRRG